ncbi:MAG: WG repeat-containing protein [Oscillospiraceae bacterium]|nr:WG repeat-containing protein [Oscillospiraceae bacterium]
MKNRILSLALTLAFLVSFLPAAVAAPYAPGMRVVELTAPSLEFDGADSFQNGLAQVYTLSEETGEGWSSWTRDKAGLVNASGALVLPMEYDQIDGFGNFGEDLARVWKDGKQGLINRTGKIVLDAEYDQIDNFWNFDGEFARVRKDNKYGLIDITGKIVLPAEYDQIDGFGIFDGEFARVWKDGKQGLMNRAGKIVVETKYDWIDWFQNGYARVQITDASMPYQGVINTAGETVLPLDYEEVWILDYSYARVESGGKYGLFNLMTKTFALPVECDLVYAAENRVDGIGTNIDGLWRVSKSIDENQWSGLYSIKTSGFVLDLARGWINNFYEGFANHGKWIDGSWKYGYVKEDGTFLIDPETSPYVSGGQFSNGLAAVQQFVPLDNGGGTYETLYINTNGQPAFEGRYDSTNTFSEGLAWVRPKDSADNQWQLINTKGEVETIFDSGSMVNFGIAGEVRDGLAQIYKEEDEPLVFGYIRTDGTLLWTEFDGVGNFLNGVAEVHKDGKYGLIDTDGNIVLPIEYDRVWINTILWGWNWGWWDYNEVSSFGNAVADGLVDEMGRPLAYIGLFDNETQQIIVDVDEEFSRYSPWSNWNTSIRYVEVQKLDGNS